jgi:hypothetical protein
LKLFRLQVSPMICDDVLHVLKIFEEILFQKVWFPVYMNSKRQKSWRIMILIKTITINSSFHGKLRIWNSICNEGTHLLHKGAFTGLAVIKIFSIRFVFLLQTRESWSGDHRYPRIPNFEWGNERNESYLKYHPET